jgi:transcriptional regulator with XRE-family HTH domain
MSSMSVMVYSRLGDLLRARNLTVSDLQRQIAARFGLTVDTRMLERLARAERVRRPDLEVAAAAAAVLDASLNDVFAVEAVPVDDGDATAASNAEDISSTRTRVGACRRSSTCASGGP